MKKTIIISICTILILMLLSTFVFADGITDSMKSLNDVNGSASLMQMANKILGIVQVIGAGTATIMLVILAIKYFYSSTDDKASIKLKLMPYAIGVIILYAGTAGLQLIKLFVSEIR